MKISKTFHYDKFIPDVLNRDVGKIKKILNSFKMYGWLEAYPMHVVSDGNNGKFVIKDGQHRFEAAKQLKMPVLYVVYDEREDVVIADINNAQSPWGFRDYLSTYCKQGKEDYLIIKDYIEKTGIAIGAAVSMFAGQTAGSGNHNDRFKRGSFKIKDTKLPAKVGDLVSFLGGIVKWNKDARLVAVLSRACRVKEFNTTVFKQKLQNEPGLLKRQATQDDFLILLENIFNHRSHRPIPLKFLVEQEMRKSTFCHNKSTD